MRLDVRRPQDWPGLLKVGEVAALLRTEPRTVGRWCLDGPLEATRIGREWRIDPASVWPLIPPSIRNHWPKGPWTIPPR